MEEKDSSTLKQEEIEENLKELEEWRLSSDKKKIFRNFYFKTFRESIDFVNEAATFAGRVKHYPEVMIIRFRKISVRLTTKKSGGLTEKDFALAKELNAIAGWKSRLEQLTISPKFLIPFLIIVLLIILWQYLQ